MKIKFNFTDHKGKKETKEVEQRAEDHFQAQRKYPHLVQKDKTKYNRKKKHKGLDKY